MKPIFYNIIIEIFISLFCLTYAQTPVNSRFIVTANDGINYSVKVQISVDSGICHLGTSNLRFSYDGDISYPLDPIPGSDYVFHNFSGDSYSPGEIVRPSSNQIGINIDLINPNTGSTVAELPDWTDVVTINFSTIDPAGFAVLDWNLPAIVVFTCDESTILSKGEFTSLNTEPLPVELTSFSATVVNGKVLLRWICPAETNNEGFIIERSDDNLTFHEIVFIEGKGTTANISEYSYMDNSALSGELLYRLKQIDHNGSFDYSEIIEVELGIPDEFILYQNFPNPFNSSTTIKFAIPVNADVNIRLYNLLGEQIIEIFDAELNKGLHEVIFNAGNLSSGIYFYNLRAQDLNGSVFNEVKRMILLK